MALYDEDLAYIHHEGFGDYARSAAEGLLAALAGRGVASGTVVDLGCGSGIWLSRLIEAGYDAVGVDQSTAMLELARNVAPEAELHLCSITDFALPPCDAVTALGEVLCYFTAEDSPPDLAAVFGRVGEALRPGGVLAFDLLVEGERMAYASARKGEDWAILLEVTENLEPRVLSRDQTIFRKQGGLYRRSQEIHRVRVCSPAEVTAELKAAGFQVETSPAYGTFELPPRRLAFFATR